MRLLLLVCLFLCGLTSEILGAEGPVFPVPLNLRDNVAFWKIIYTKITYKTGLLHDREYPLIIYDTVVVGDRWGKGVDNIVLQPRNKVVQLLKNIRSKPCSQWTASEIRIASLYKRYATMGALKNAEDRIRFQRGQKEQFYEGLVRSSAYIDTIRVIFSKYGIPDRLAYLPHVESSFNYNARSKAGAAGLWQIMPETGRSMLSIGEYIDERHDPILSSVAAAKVLSKNFKLLKSWPLAITAYNYGTSGMLRAVKKLESNDIGTIIDRHDSPSFRFASKNFYSCFLAASEIAANASAYFGDVPVKPKYMYRSYILKREITAEGLCAKLGITKERLISLNPSLRPSLFTHQRKIPSGYSLKFDGKEEPISFLLIDKMFDFDIDTADIKTLNSNILPIEFSLLKQTNRLGIQLTVTDFREFKRIVFSSLPLPSFALISHRVGSPGIVPLVIAAPPADSAILLSVLNLQKRLIRRDMSVGDTPTIVITQIDKVNEIGTVDKKDPVTFSKEDGFDLNDAQVNTGVLDNFKSRFDSRLYDFSVHIVHNRRAFEIIVSADETISHYAQWLDISASNIRRMNDLHSNESIRAGLHILLPFSKLGVDQFMQRRTDYHIALEELFYKRYDITGVESRIVKRGDNLWDLLEGNVHIPLWLFRKYNRTIDFKKIGDGTEVSIPIVSLKNRS